MPLYLRLLLWAQRLLQGKPLEKRPPLAARPHIEAQYHLLQRLTARRPPTAGRVREDEILTETGLRLPVRVYEPKGSGPWPVVLFFHGGGFVLNRPQTYDRSCRELGAASGRLVISVAYRRAPEHPFPAAVEDAFAALRWAQQKVQAWGGNPQRIAVAGNSAGGTLSAALCLMARDRGLPLPEKQVLLCPLTDARHDYPSVTTFARHHLLTRAQLFWFRQHYAPDEADWTHPYYSVLLAESHAGLPPALILTAACDPLRDEGAAFAQKLQKAGVAVDYYDYPGMVHEFYLLTRLSPSARDCWQRVGQFLQS